jgi:ATP-binding cassette, subfamily C (CFTR/MRP), member 1
VALIRGGLISAVYEKTTESQMLAKNDAAAITLMSTYIERVIGGLTDMHDLWAAILEAGLRCWRL